MWEIYLIQGLPGGRVALYAKVHHAAIDGVGGAELLAALLDLGPEPREVDATHHQPERSPHLVAMAARAAGQPVRGARSLVRTVRGLDQVPVAGRLPGAGRLARALRGGAVAPPEVPLRAPRTPFNGSITERRSVAFGSLPLEEIKTVRRALGSSVNDVVMTLCATALRHWLIERDALPGGPLVAAVPVALRSDGGGCNAISALIAPVATDVADPVERAEAVRRAMSTAKRSFAGASGGWIGDVTSLLPPALAGTAVRSALRLGRVSPVNLVISNVPGPRFGLYLGGARVRSYYPLSLISDVTGGVSITFFSYDGGMDVGVVACPALVPDPWELVHHLRAALDELLAVSRAA